MPNLRTVNIETEDIIDMEANVINVLEILPALERIELRESRVGPARPLDCNTNPYEVLQSSCKQRGIQLHSVYSFLRADEPTELICEAQRMAILSESLTELHLTCQPKALSAIARLLPIQVPCLERLWLAVGDIMSSMQGEVEDVSAPEQPLYNLCKWLQAPGCRELEVTLFINDQSAIGTFLDLQSILEDRLYPNLEQISGTLMALPGMSVESLDSCEMGIRRACKKSSIDDRGLKFVGRKSLIPKLVEPRVTGTPVFKESHEQTGLDHSVDDASECIDGEEWIRSQLNELSLEGQREAPVVTGRHLRWD